MNLTEAIIKQDKKKAFEFIESGQHLNEIDIHGFTPLIEAAIVNDLDIAKKLIAHGANPTKRDLTGGTALHWAVENNNLALCELLLENGADPNAYGKSGQPILVQPLLRRQQDLKELLYRYSADLKFAQDYISIKLIGHRFELVGRVDLVDHKNTFIEVDFEGFILEFTLSVMLESLVQLKNNFAGRILRPYFDDLEDVIQAFVVACELNRYQQYQANRHIDQYMYRLEVLCQQSPCLILPVGYEGHAITFVKCGNLLAKCDRGANSLNHPSVEIFHIGKLHQFNATFLKHLLYKRQNRYFVTDGIVSLLDLKPIATLNLPSQLTGNCSWANVEAAIPALILMRWLKENQNTHSHDLKHHKKKALYVYRRWLEWDKDWALHNCVENFYDATPSRKASRAAVLAAVLAQTCRYTDPEDITRANKILAVLATSEYKYVLESYLKTYKNTQIAHNLKELVDLYGRG
jgi:hypothetical protein